MKKMVLLKKVGKREKGHADARNAGQSNYITTNNFFETTIAFNFAVEMFGQGKDMPFLSYMFLVQHFLYMHQ